MIGIIVDGPGDHAAFKARYGNTMRVVKTGGARGHTVSCDALVVSAKKEIAMLRAFRCAPIAIVTDLEQRGESADRFCELAHRCMKGKPEYDDVLLFVSDRMIENWFLADIVNLSSQKKYLKRVRAQRRFESLHGKQELKKLFAPGYDYNEVRHSAELFPLVRGEVAAGFSSSFARFRTELGVD